MSQIKLAPNSLNLFLECPACFWLDKNQGIKRPIEYPHSLNLELDMLLRDEFDAYRKLNQLPPVLEKVKIKAKLFENQKLLGQWRNKSAGLAYFDEELETTLFGVIDDILEFEDGLLAPLDYKSTSKPLEKVYDKFQLQLDVYAFLLDKNGFKTNKKGFLVFYIVDKNKGFLDRIPFKKDYLQIKTSPEDIYDIFKEAVGVLKSEKLPKHSQDCQFGKWLGEIKSFT